MIVLDHEQGSDEWHAARLGIPTASEFARIITASGKPSAQQTAYIGELLFERQFGIAKDRYNPDDPSEPYDDGFKGSRWVALGKANEAQAREVYAFETGAEFASVGLCLTDDRRCGASPDVLVGPNGQGELKCPAPWTHLGYVAEDVMPRDHHVQVQSQLWVTGRDWSDFVSFSDEVDPALRMFRVRVSPEPGFQGALDKIVPEFLAKLDERQAMLEERGAAPWRQTA